MMDRINLLVNHPTFRQNLEEIEAQERERRFCRHGMAHILDVARLMALRASETHIEISGEMLYATALLHDIGRAEQYREGTEHETAGLAIAGPILSDCGFSESEQLQILAAIENHRNPEGCDDALANLLFWADKKSRPCFFCAVVSECHRPETQKNLRLEV